MGRVAGRPTARQYWAGERPAIMSRNPMNCPRSRDPPEDFSRRKPPRSSRNRAGGGRSARSSAPSGGLATWAGSRPPGGSSRRCRSRPDAGRGRGGHPRVRRGARDRLRGHGHRGPNRARRAPHGEHGRARARPAARFDRGGEAAGLRGPVHLIPDAEAGNAGPERAVAAAPQRTRALMRMLVDDVLLT